MEVIQPDRVYTTRELADLLKVNPVTIRRWIKAGKLRALRLGHDYRIKGSDILEAMSKAEVKGEG